MSKFEKHFRMGEQDAIDYAREQTDCFAKEAVLNASEIGDGNINYVFKVWDVSTGHSIIIKHADVLLRSSGRELDVNRNRIEANILKLEARYAPGLVPEVYKYDPVMCVMVMEDVSDYKNLRTELLARKTFPRLADDITTFMVNTMLPTTDLVMKPSEKKDQVKEFTNKDLCDISEDLVFTEPYVDYKSRNIILPDNLSFVERELYQDHALICEVAKLKNNFKNNAQALIHGDLHSGSIFANQHGTKVLDPEFAFYGPMGYDLGNVIGNLFFAWANAWATEQDPDRYTAFTKWIGDTICEVVTLFKTKFLALYREIVTDPVSKSEDYMMWYLHSILADASGSAGLEIIRRVVGDSKVADITQIPVGPQRLEAERLLVKVGKQMIFARTTMTEASHYRNVLNLVCDRK